MCVFETFQNVYDFLSTKGGCILFATPVGGKRLPEGIFLPFIGDRGPPFPIDIINAMK